MSIFGKVPYKWWSNKKIIDHKLHTFYGWNQRKQINFIFQDITGSSSIDCNNYVEKVQQFTNNCSSRFNQNIYLLWGQIIIQRILVPWIKMFKFYEINSLKKNKDYATSMETIYILWGQIFISEKQNFVNHITLIMMNVLDFMELLIFNN